jgi:hypothetical protein
MVFAGEVFPEWYWGPIFFFIVFGLPLSAAALAVDFAVRRWVRRLSWPQRAGLWVGVVAGGSLAILGGRALIDHVRFERDAKAASRKLDFAPYTADALPAGFDEELVRADDFFGGPVIVSRYAVGPGAYASAFQQRPAELSLQEGRCALYGLAGSSTNFFEGPCRELRTPRGRTVYLGTPANLVDGGEAFALLDGTLVRLQYVQVADRDVLAYFDSLRPVAPEDLDFKKG